MSRSAPEVEHREFVAVTRSLAETVEKGFMFGDRVVAEHNLEERRFKAIAYLRRGCEPKSDDIGVSVMRKAMQIKAQQRHADIVGEFVAVGSAGAEHPAFRRLLDTVRERGDIDYVITYHYAMSRRMFHDIEMRVLLQELGVRVISALDDVDEFPMSEAVRTISEIFHEFTYGKYSGRGLRATR